MAVAYIQITPERKIRIKSIADTGILPEINFTSINRHLYNHVYEERHGLNESCKESIWSRGNAFVSGAEGLRFKSMAGQIGHLVANSLLPLDISS